jgi:cell division protein DivIC
MKKALKLLTNKYLITGAAFVVWVMYFDQNDWVSLKKTQKELNGVKDNISYLNAEIARMNNEKNALLNDPSRLERYARENYHMKHDGEDIYVIDNSTAH